jgi:hypothetical protein
MPEVFWYPSIGNKGYPYTTWEYKQKEWSWNTLENLELIYNNIYRYLRRTYKWSPDVVDKIELTRLFRIYDETVEDSKKRVNENEDDFE